MTNTATRPLPVFQSEAEERAFWESRDTDVAEYFDVAAMKAVQLKNLKPSAASKPVKPACPAGRLDRSSGHQAA